MLYDFDALLDRCRVDSIKWNRYGPNVIPLWVADMDFRASDPVIQALQEHVAHGNFDYPERKLICHSESNQSILS